MKVVETITRGAAGREDDVHVIEDSEAERRRKQELEERLREQEGDEPGLPERLPNPDRSGSVKTMIAQARKHRGYREKGDNDTRFNRWLGRIRDYPHGGYGYPWCHSFVSYCLWHSGNADVGPRTAGCAVGVGWFKSAGRWHSSPKPGDFVYYGRGGGTHVELVVAVSPGAIRTIGGNTSGSMGGNYFNGNGVYEKKVSRSSSRIYGYGRPAYRGSGSDDIAISLPLLKKGASGPAVRRLQGLLRAAYPKLTDADLSLPGDFGPKTDKLVRKFQREHKLEVDGEVGPRTWWALLGRKLPRLRKGARGNAVRRLHGLLRAADPKLTDADLTLAGSFGPTTEELVRKVQRQHKLDVIGRVGPRTWRALLGLRQH